MSTQARIKAICPQCGTPFELNIWDTIDTRSFPDAPSQIISGQLFNHKCPSCSFICHISHLRVYHDLNHKMLIWMITRQRNLSACLKEISKADIPSGYLVRITQNTNELSEKVSALEAGRDDRVIEIVKQLYILQHTSKNPGYKVRSAFYSYVNGKETIKLCDFSGNINAGLLNCAIYQDICHLINKLPSSFFKGFVYDMEWGKKALDSLQKTLNKEAVAEGLSLKDYIKRLVAEFQKYKSDQSAEPHQETDSNTDANNGSYGTAANYCHKCGAKLFPGSTFCHKCGTRITAPKDSSASSPGARTRSTQGLSFKNRSVFRKTLIAAAILLVSFALFSNREYLKVKFLYDFSFDSDQRLSYETGDTFKLKYATNIDDFSLTDISFRSSDPLVAYTSAGGIVTAKSEGTAVITASIDGIVKDTCTINISPKPVNTFNGQMLVYPDYTSYPEVTVNAPKNENCFVYFKNNYNSSNDFAFYVSAASSATVNTPPGVYTLFYACGDTWYGQKYLFGNDTSFYKSPEDIILTEDSTSYDILELTLYPVVGGNMSTVTIDESDFPSLE